MLSVVRKDVGHIPQFSVQLSPIILPAKLYVRSGFDSSYVELKLDAKDHSFFDWKSDACRIYKNPILIILV